MRLPPEPDARVARALKTLERYERLRALIGHERWSAMGLPGGVPSMQRVRVYTVDGTHDFDGDKLGYKVDGYENMTVYNEDRQVATFARGYWRAISTSPPLDEKK